MLFGRTIGSIADISEGKENILFRINFNPLLPSI